ncbi:MAG: transposase [Tepidisphaeraceae bacterium]
MLASHLIFSAHGFWLPNDPRGSWSKCVRSLDLYRAAGPATTTGAQSSVAYAEHDRAARLAAKSSLTYPPVRFDSAQARVLAKAFKEAAVESSYAVYALAVMPDHVHAVVGIHANAPSRIIAHWKARSTQALIAAGLHPFAGRVRKDGRVPQVWAHRGWKVFLSTPDDVWRAIDYVNQNPIRASMRPQRYSFLTDFKAT